MKGRLAKFTLDNGDVSYGTVMLPPVNFGDQPKPGMMPAFHSYEAAMSVCNVNADLFREIMDREVRARAKAIDDACRAGPDACA